MPQNPNLDRVLDLYREWTRAVYRNTDRYDEVTRLAKKLSPEEKEEYAIGIDRIAKEERKRYRES